MARCTASRRFKGWTGEVRCDLDEHQGRVHMSQVNGLRWFEGKVAQKQRMASDRRLRERMQAIEEARTKGGGFLDRLKAVFRVQRMRKKMEGSDGG